MLLEVFIEENMEGWNMDLKRVFKFKDLIKLHINTSLKLLENQKPKRN